MLNNQFDKLSDGSPDVEKFIQKIKDEGISAVGLTNYFNFNDNDFKLKERLNKEGIATFLNLEIRLSYINKSDQLFDYHIIFDNKLPDIIIKNLLGQLKANIGSTNKSFNTLTNSEIENVANIDLSQLLKVLNNDKELNVRFLTEFLSRGHGSATSDSDPKNGAVYENICVNSDFLIHSSCDNPATCKDKKCEHNNILVDRKFWLDKSPYVRPILQSSDSHSLEQIGSKYSWVKADLTFDGLEQIKYEPEYRISVEKEKPTLKKDELVIDNILYNGQDIYLSENLNTIIGCRSTGKSTLLNSIAKKLGRELNGDSYYFENMDDFQIIWKDQQEDNSRQIEYIPQEYMFALARDNKKLKDLVGSIIQSKEMNSELKKYEQNCTTLHLEIRGLLDSYKENQKNIHELIKPEAEKQATQNRIKTYETKKKELLNASEITEQERDLFENKNKELQLLKTQKEIHESDLRYVSSILPITFEVESLPTTTTPSQDLRVKIGQITARLRDSVRAQQEHEIRIIKLEKESLIKAIENKISDIENDDIYKKCVEAMKNNSEIARLNSLIKNEVDILAKIEAFEKQRDEFDKVTEEIQKEIISKYKEYSNIRTELLNNFKIEDDNGDNLKISVKFSLIDLEAEFDYINARGRSKQDFIEKMIGSFEEVVDSIFDEDSLVFNGNRDKFSHIEHFFTTNFYEYSFEIEYQGDKFEQMSPGKKAFIVLKLILEFSDSKTPVLIDHLKIVWIIGQYIVN
ncbi:putative ATPase involved in DNA repair [Streptococcus pneumoniae]|nr:putative ATPase involved in DNA repair [Streptococcus pneumoniae]